MQITKTLTPVKVLPVEIDGKLNFNQDIRIFVHLLPITEIVLLYNFTDMLR